MRERGLEPEIEAQNPKKPTQEGGMEQFPTKRISNEDPEMGGK